MATPDGPVPEEIHHPADLVRALERLRVRAAVGTGKVRLSVRDIARSTGIPRSTLAGYLSGATLVPPDLLGTLVRALGATPEETGEWIRAARRVAESRHGTVSVGREGGVPDRSPPAAVPIEASTATEPGAIGADDGGAPTPRRRLGRNVSPVAVMAMVGVIIAASAVAAIWFDRAPRTVTQVSAWASVTPDRHGVARIPYCAADPCRFDDVPRVVVTGRHPIRGGSIPAGLIADGVSPAEFAVRVLNARGRPVTTPIELWFHAAVPGTGAAEETGTATVRTDADGSATVTYTARGRGVPAAVVASGISPTNGPVIPANILVTRRGANDFQILALSHRGTRITNISITVAYLVIWAAGSGTDGRARRAATTTVTTDAEGSAIVRYPRPMPAAPRMVQAVAVGPSAGAAIAGTVLPHSATEVGFWVRVLDRYGNGLPATPVTLSYVAA